MTGAHAHVALSPGVYHDLPTEIVHVEPGATLNGKGGVAHSLSLPLALPLALGE